MTKSTHKTQYLSALPLVVMGVTSAALFSIGRLLQVVDDNLVELGDDEILTL